MDNIQKIYEQALTHTDKGAVATYIPALAEVDGKQLSISILSNEQEISFGNQEVSFTLQSVVKIMSFIVAANHHGLEQLLTYVDVEPTGDSFNSIVRLESDTKKPFNPMINAGAITVASLLPGERLYDKVQSVLTFIESIIERDVMVDQQIYLSEYESADYNRAIAYILQANGFLHSEVEEALQVYLQLCSIRVTTKDLAKLGLFFATSGQLCKTAYQKEILNVAKALMMTCGMYNASGNFAAFVGLPAKSGVSGAIVAFSKHATIEHVSGPIGYGIYGPSIDEVGNSVAGRYFLEELSKAYDLFSL